MDPILLLPHRYETKVYVAEEGYVTLTQEMPGSADMQNVVYVHHTDIPALVEALRTASEEAQKMHITSFSEEEGIQTE